MTKQELFLRLADAMHEEIITESAAKGRDCHECLGIVEQDMGIWWPIIVEFTADWMRQYYGYEVESVIDRWMGEMGNE